ncbi:MAG: alpha/beta hydrolase [Actinobacteria bacterium]|jgi:pimeloyl-ACP methyl ester carboxylesterase|nr:MAG: alpha/beta hydrolase [Actinomycetota bacterium]
MHPRKATLGFGIAALAGAAIALSWRSRLMPRRDPRLPYEEFTVTTPDGMSIAARRIPGGSRGAVIVAHPAVTGQRYLPLVDFAEMLAEHYDVFTFDFRGHGGSGGRLELDLSGPLDDMRGVIARVREGGYPWVGAVGFSLGGMAAFLHAALWGGLDAVITVGAPPLLPDIEPYRRILPLWSLFLRLLGARFKAVNEGGPLPMHVAGSFPNVPLLVVHGGAEAFYQRDDLDEMLERLHGKAELLVIEGAGHTELNGRERELIDWLLSVSGMGLTPIDLIG